MVVWNLNTSLSFLCFSSKLCLFLLCCLCTHFYWVAQRDFSVQLSVCGSRNSHINLSASFHRLIQQQVLNAQTPWVTVTEYNCTCVRLISTWMMPPELFHLVAFFPLWQSSIHQVYFNILNFSCQLSYTPLCYCNLG